MRKLEFDIILNSALIIMMLTDGNKFCQSIAFFFIISNLIFSVINFELGEELKRLQKEEELLNEINRR